ncbi:MAG TPA: ABC transporter permease, partial [Deinococcales bacterium]|nr:ABC transporter permease [Deinococcales bacterium]
IYFRDPTTGQLSWPFVYATKRQVNMETFLTEYAEDRTTKYPIKFLVSRPEQPYRLLGFIPANLRLFGVDEPARVFLLGTDSFGRDLFTRIWYGSQVSLTIGIVGVFLSFLLGLFFGGLAGFYRGWVDNLIMRLVEVIGAIPDLFLLITLTALIPRDVNPILVFYFVVFFLGLINWGGLARVVRSQILALREVDFVQAAIALGAKESRIIIAHMLPNTATYLIVSASLAIPGYILAESGLSFIGRGIREPYSSWGLLLNDVTEGGFASFVDRPWVLIPGFFIVLAILCWNFLGDGLRDAFDPKKRR